MTGVQFAEQWCRQTGRLEWVRQAMRLWPCISLTAHLDVHERSYAVASCVAGTSAISREPYALAWGRAHAAAAVPFTKHRRLDRLPEITLADTDDPDRDRNYDRRLTLPPAEDGAYRVGDSIVVRVRVYTSIRESGPTEGVSLEYLQRVG